MSQEIWKKMLEQMKMDTIWENSCVAAKAVILETFVAINDYIKEKRNISKTSKLYTWRK